VATQTFVGTGAHIDANGATQPQFLWFSRELDEPTWVPLNVNSTPITGVSITMDVLDRNGQGSGTTNFVRSMPPRQGYTLTAPATHTVGSSIYRFDRWELNGALQAIDERVLAVPDIVNAADTCEAQYRVQRTLNVQSTNPASGVAITVNVADVNGAQNGSTSFSRIYKTGTQVILTAPAFVGINPFRRWRINNIIQPQGLLTLTTTVDLPTETAVADYWIHTHGSFASYGAGCLGINGVITQGASGHPDIGSVVNYNVINGPVNSLAILVLGFSNTNWLGIPLPLPLVQAPGCSIYTDLVVTFNVLTNATGAGSAAVAIANDVSIIGGHYYTQFWGLQLGFNPLGLSFSNGINTTMGGNQ
jgi:hypothetical protein